ncbi:MAG: TetR/AcrR family transcriptional regulator [Defluviitaleaceae bacterium]|nr:TetR/AcrR family transcriptional regulator [Defluviitaleaceae bacterium]
MYSQTKSTGIEKFMAQSEAKRDRIVNAAMKEFRYGYKRASTDAIVKDAGISKGLLFHYFSTKDNLYEFLVRFAMDTMQNDYFDMVNLGQNDIIESIWQQALLKRDISDKYPYIYSFLTTVSISTKEDGSLDPDISNHMSALYVQKNREMLEDAFKCCDTTLFKEYVDPQKAINIIIWSVNGLFDSTENTVFEESNIDGESYERFLDELRSYLDIFRTTFYKSE